MKTSVTKIFTFDTSHRLSNYSGKCFRLHGHTYKLELTLEGEIDNSGMIVDFSEIKDIYKKYIEGTFDHKVVLFKDDPLNQTIATSFPIDWISWVNYNPTAENMAIDIGNTISQNLKSAVKLTEVILWETPTAFAKVNFNSK